MIQELKEKVNGLEKNVQDYIRNTERCFTKLINNQIDFQVTINSLIEESRLAREHSEKSMEEFKEESRLAREHSEKSMEEFKEESRLAREHSEKSMEEFKEESRLAREHSEKSMEEFKEESRLAREHSEKSMGEFKEKTRLSWEHYDRKVLEINTRMDNSKKELDLKWALLAHRLGTLAEDITAPNIPVIAKKYFQCTGEPDHLSVRSKRKNSKDKSRRREFDVIAAYEEKVIVNETKATARLKYLEDFAGMLPHFFDYFPELQGRQIIPIFAALYMEESFIKYATKKKIYVMSLSGDTMDLLNYNHF